MIEVMVGQIWKDNDKRHTGSHERYLRVALIQDDKAVCEPVTSEGVRMPRTTTTKILLARFKPTANGYRLVRDVP